MPAYEFRTSSPEGVQADVKFARNMRRHHQGAIDMSEIYLRDQRGQNPILRKLATGIIPNQRFEIALLDDVARTLEREDPGSGLRKVGRLGSDYAWGFLRFPPPGTLDRLAWNGRVSDYDVQYARDMIAHHEMALKMARDYNGNAATSNRVLKEMNIDLMFDQANEISLLRSLVGQYPGDAAAVPPDPALRKAMMASMEGMDGMPMEMHGGH